MRKKQNKQELVEKRKVALELLDKGKSASEVAEIVSVTIRSIFRWQEQRENPKLCQTVEGLSHRLQTLVEIAIAVTFIYSRLNNINGRTS